MRLPREIRDDIYYLSILSQSPPSPHSLFNHQQILSPIAEVVISNPYSDVSPFWGREPMTRLLRVSRTFQDEAEAILYSRFPLCWHEDTDKAMVQKVLTRLRTQARGLIRCIRLHMTLCIMVEKWEEEFAESRRT